MYEQMEISADKVRFVLAGGLNQLGRLIEKLHDFIEPQQSIFGVTDDGISCIHMDVVEANRERRIRAGFEQDAQTT